MVRPLDHVTVIQQINFAEREHQNQQTHPEMSRLASEEVELRKAAEDRRRTKETQKSEKNAVHLDERRQEGNRQRRRRGKGPADGEKGGSVDITV